MSKRLIPKFNNIRDRDAFRLKVCQDFISSGLSKPEYCDKRKISDSSLYRWLGYFKDTLGSSQSATHLNVPIKMQKPVLTKKLVSKTAFLPVQVKQPEPPALKNLVIYPKTDIVTLESQLPLAQIHSLSIGFSGFEVLNCLSILCIDCPTSVSPTLINPSFLYMGVVYTYNSLVIMTIP